MSRLSHSHRAEINRPRSTDPTIVIGATGNPQDSGMRSIFDIWCTIRANANGSTLIRK